MTLATTVPLWYILQIQFPTANFNFNTGVQLADYGNGPVIAQWNNPGLTEPTISQLTEWATDVTVLSTYNTMMGNT